MKSEGIRHNLAPHKDEGAAVDAGEAVALPELYVDHLRAYTAIRQELRKFQNEFMPKLHDPEIRSRMDEIDMRLHNKHLELNALAQQMGKGSADVLVDIFRTEGNLDSAGLPEFAVLTTDDIFPFTDDFVMSADNFKPRRGEFDTPKTIRMAGGDTFRMKANEVMLIYNVVAYWGNVGNNEKYQLLAPDDRIRLQRARALAAAEGVHGRVALFKDNDTFHSHMLSVQGVIIPKAEIDYVTGVIKSFARKYRLGDAFYSEEEEQEAKRTYKDQLFHTFNLLTSYRDQAEGEKHVRQFLAAVFNVRGKAAHEEAVHVYEQWREKRRD